MHILTTSKYWSFCALEVFLKWHFWHCRYLSFFERCSVSLINLEGWTKRKVFILLILIKTNEEKKEKIYTANSKNQVYQLLRGIQPTNLSRSYYISCRSFEHGKTWAFNLPKMPMRTCVHRSLFLNMWPSSLAFQAYLCNMILYSVPFMLIVKLHKRLAMKWVPTITMIMDI